MSKLFAWLFRSERDELIKLLLADVLEMHRVDAEYGSGYYGQDDWIDPYLRTKELAERISSL